MLWLKGMSQTLATCSHSRSWIQTGDPATTRCVRSAHGSDPAFTSTYSFAVLVFGVFLDLNPTYRTVVRLLTPSQGGDGSTRVERADPDLPEQRGSTCLSTSRQTQALSEMVILRLGCKGKPLPFSALNQATDQMEPYYFCNENSILHEPETQKKYQRKVH